MKARCIARLIALFLSTALISCTSMIENGHDHRHDPKFKQKQESPGSN